MNLTGKVNDDLQSISRRPPPQPYKIYRTWVMVIDQHIARLFERYEGELEPIGEAFPDPPENIELSNKSIGRVLGSAGRWAHHKYEPHMNESRQQRLVFTSQISDWLTQAVHEDAFDRLIIAAPPKILGDLRKMIKQPVQERIFAEINKDFTKLSVHELQEQLEKEIVFK